MITAIREVRRAKGMTLEDVGRACMPPTTAQTIGRLETGTRTVSVGWLNRIADALGVAAADLVKLPGRADLPVAAILDAAGAHAPRRATTAAPPQPAPGQIAITVTGGVGDYRSGDEIWCETLAPDAFASALNRDVLVSRPAGRFVFGRLAELNGATVRIVPPGSGSEPSTIADPAWIARAVRLVRSL